MRVPLHLDTNGRSISSAVISLDYDERYLDLPLDDADQNGVPDAVALLLPRGFSATVTVDPTDTDSELDVVLFDPIPPLALLEAGSMLTVTFAVGRPAVSTLADVAFATNPKPSLGSDAGRSVPVTSSAGSVLIAGPTPQSPPAFTATASAEPTAPIATERPTAHPGSPGPSPTPPDPSPGPPTASPPPIPPTATQPAAGPPSPTPWQTASFATPPSPAAPAEQRLLLPSLGLSGRRSGAGALALARPLLAAPLTRAPAQTGPSTQARPRLSLRPQAATAGVGPGVALHLATGGQSVGVLVFSLDYDPAALAFDAADANGDDLPDAVTLTLPKGIDGIVNHDAADAEGELDLLISSFRAPMPALVDGPILTIRFRALGSRAPDQATLRFSQEPAPSFGSTDGRSLRGEVSSDLPPAPPAPATASGSPSRLTPPLPAASKEATTTGPRPPADGTRPSASESAASAGPLDSAAGRPASADRSLGSPTAPGSVGGASSQAGAQPVAVTLPPDLRRPTPSAVPPLTKGPGGESLAPDNTAGPGADNPSALATLVLDRAAPHLPAHPPYAATQRSRLAPVGAGLLALGGALLLLKRRNTQRHSARRQR